MKIINTLSGGKDSQATTLWLLNNGYKNFETIFCDTGWESDITYSHLKYIDEHLKLNLRVLRSKKYKSLIDLARRKTRFPSTTRRFCTSELKNIPMIDYILDEVQDHILVIQGIRAGESESRSKMSAQCNYFKYYFDPIETNTSRIVKLEKYLNGLRSNESNLQLDLWGDDQFESESVDDNILKIQSRIEYLKDRLQKGKEDPKYHTYRRKEVLAYCKKFATDVLRPIFDWTAQEVIDYILDNMMKPNPLYKMGVTRVGCFPCVNCNLMEIHQINLRFPERIQEIANYEKEIGSTFFPYDKISDKYCKQPSIIDVAKYASAKYEAGELFDDNEPTSCMSHYGLCE